MNRPCSPAIPSCGERFGRRVGVSRKNKFVIGFYLGNPSVKLLASADTRAMIATMLPKMAGGRDYIKALIAVVKTDPSDTVRLAAINPLREFGQDAREAESLFRIAKSNSNDAMRSAPARALNLVKPD